MDPPVQPSETHTAEDHPSAKMKEPEGQSSDISDLSKSSLCLLFENPSQSLVIPKGDDVIFDLPENYYNKRYRKYNESIRQKFISDDVKLIPVKNTTVPVDVVERAASIDKGFSVLIPHHMECAVELIQCFMEAENVEDLLSIAAYCRERIGPLLFNYALSVAILHREDTKDLSVPNLVFSFPGKFVNATVFADARKEANLIPAPSRQPIVINRNFTATNREPEQAIAYFREDIGINLHHWHWHLVYPTRGGEKIVNKDRRGELFYYMHEQVLARYNTERLCNNMNMVVSIKSLRESILEGYFSKLTQINSNRAWPPRFMYSFLKNIDRPSDRINLKIETIESWMDRVKQAISNGQVMTDDGTILLLNNPQGIDVLGNIVEASDMSVNKNFYGNLHNMVHVLIALCHDPEERYLEGFSLMGDVATAMRDPVFYRWHSAINDIFVSHKIKLPPYTTNEIGFTGITLTNLYVDVPNRKRNEINTFWESSTIDMSAGLDFVNKGPLPITITYLQHGKYTFTIEVNNATGNLVMGTMRIFIAPKSDRNGQPLSFEVTRQLMIELDKFTVSLSNGANVIKRSSDDSSVSIPYKNTFVTIDTANMSAAELKKYNFCGCGWPDNMMIPRGNTSTAGYRMNLFAMISDYTNDSVTQTTENSICRGSESYCGVFDNKYPDRRSMGYPFDRRAPNNVTNLTQFLLPNMRVTEIGIRHVNTTVPRPVQAPTVGGA